MLSIHTSSGGENLSRRAVLRVGTLGLGGWALSDLVAHKARGADRQQGLRDKSVIFLFLHGGPSQTETFDPKMTAPIGIQSQTGEVATTLPGITYGGTFPRLARLADKLSVVRSFQTGDGQHDIKPVVSRYSIDANVGSLYARMAGTTHPRTGMPTNIALFPRAVDGTAQPANHRFGNFASAGSLGPAYAPFVSGSGQLQQDMQMHLPADRLADRRSLLAQLDRGRRQLESISEEVSLDRFRQQAFDTILGSVAAAFDLSREDPRIVARYDTAPLVRPDQISKRWNNYANYVDNARTLGKLLLLARRLCQAGCGFVTVTTNFVWDMHADVNNAGVYEGMQYLGGPLYYALSAFIEDVEARGMRDDILLVACGEMGRTPRVNDNGGRDHWGRIAPLLLYGGGLRMGQVVGESTRDAGEPATRAYGIENLVGTIMHTLVDVGEVRLQSELPTDLVRAVTRATPIPELVA